MKYTVLEALLENAQVVDGLRGNPATAKLHECIHAFMKVFGFVTGREQYGSESDNRPYPFSAYGYRCSENSADNKAVALLKYIFYPHIQGYIAPALKRNDRTPFHQELCLFNPSDALARTRVKNIDQYNNFKNRLHSRRLELEGEFIVTDGSMGGSLVRPKSGGTKAPTTSTNASKAVPLAVNLPNAHSTENKNGTDQNPGPISQKLHGSEKVMPNPKNGDNTKVQANIVHQPSQAHYVASVTGSVGSQSSGISPTSSLPVSRTSSIENADILSNSTASLALKALRNAQVKRSKLAIQCNDTLCSECEDNIVFTTEEFRVLELIKNSVMSQIII